MSRVPQQRQHAPWVKVTIDETESSLNAVVEAARQAHRRRVPLELVVEMHPSEPPAAGERARLVQQMDLAVELARAVVPGLDVRVPCTNPLAPAD
jgi:hypothetical protein